MIFTFCLFFCANFLKETYLKDYRFIRFNKKRPWWCQARTSQLPIHLHASNNSFLSSLSCRFENCPTPVWHSFGHYFNKSLISSVGALTVPSTRQTQFVYSSDFLLEKSCLFYLAEVSISARFLYLKTNRYLSLCWWLMLKVFFFNPWLKYTCDMINMCFIFSKLCLRKYLQHQGSKNSSKFSNRSAAIISPVLISRWFLETKSCWAFILYQLIDTAMSEICWQVKL